jgi:hypothetical protein
VGSHVRRYSRLVRTSVLTAAALVLALATPPPVSAIAHTSSLGAASSPLARTGRGITATKGSTTATTATATTATTTPVATKTASSSTTQATVSEEPVPVLESHVPPPGRRLSPDQVLAIARALPKMRALQAEYPGSFADAYLKGPLHWQVSFFSKRGAKEIGLVIIADSSGRVLEQWTGWQVAWSMARGYPGAFGRHVNALYIWLPLCVLFLLPFIDPRRPLQLLHLDLLVLLSFSVSLAFFNHAHIYASVPLAYPPLIYLLGRMLWLASRRSMRARPPGVHQPGAHPPAAHQPGVHPGSERPSRPLRLLVPVPWLALGVMFLLGFRIALNVTDSNVIDVGYAGVIGAEKVVHGDALYGHWPSDNEHGDTYGPVAYESYVPFEQIFGWSGTWDDLPAAHAAAIVFDLLATGLMFALGMRIRGPTLGVALAYAWVSYPFTLFALESNSNDTLVAVFILAALLFATSPPARGVFAALAGLTKFAPLALVPVLATHGLFNQGAADVDDHGEVPKAPLTDVGAADSVDLDPEVDPHGSATRDEGNVRDVGGESIIWRRERARRRARALTSFLLAFALTVAIVSIPALTHDSLRTIYERTLEYQANRDSPFSVWGLYGWHGAETVVEVAAVLLALALAVVPRRADVIGLAAACGAIVIAVQLGIEHWFYLYIPWFFGVVMLVLLGARPPARAGDPDPPPGARISGQASMGWPVAAPADAASEPARLRLPSTAWPSSG